MIFVSNDMPPEGLKQGCVGLSALNTNIPTFLNLLCAGVGKANNISATKGGCSWFYKQGSGLYETFVKESDK